MSSSLAVFFSDRNKTVLFDFASSLSRYEDWCYCIFFFGCALVVIVTSKGVY